MIRRNTDLFGDEQGGFSRANMKAATYSGAAVPEREPDETDVDNVETVRSPFVGRARAKSAEDAARREQEKFIYDQFIDLFGRVPPSDQIWKRPEGKE